MHFSTRILVKLVLKSVIFPDLTPHTNQMESLPYTPRVRRKKNRRFRVQNQNLVHCTPHFFLDHGNKGDNRRHYTGFLEGSAVKVVHSGDIHDLYNMGCFGKGVFSRSRPEHATSAVVIPPPSRELCPLKLMRHNKYIKHLNWRNESMADKGDYSEICDYFSEDEDVKLLAHNEMKADDDVKADDGNCDSSPNSIKLISNQTNNLTGTFPSVSNNFHQVNTTFDTNVQKQDSEMKSVNDKIMDWDEMEADENFWSDVKPELEGEKVDVINGKLKDENDHEFVITETDKGTSSNQSEMQMLDHPSTIVSNDEMDNIENKMKQTVQSDVLTANTTNNDSVQNSNQISTSYTIETCKYTENEPKVISSTNFNILIEHDPDSKTNIQDINEKSDQSSSTIRIRNDQCSSQNDQNIEDKSCIMTSKNNPCSSINDKNIEDFSNISVDYPSQNYTNIEDDLHKMPATEGKDYCPQNDPTIKDESNKIVASTVKDPLCLHEQDGDLLVVPDAYSRRETSCKGGNSKWTPVIKRDPFPMTEYLLLSLEEAFFLSYGLGSLIVKDQTNTAMDIISMWRRFCDCRQSFLPFYVAYHHFRTQGWVPKCGVKFGVHFLLYKGGPDSHHASFAVLIQSVDSNSLHSIADLDTSWASLQGLNRVSENVAKEVLVCYVIGPALDTISTQSPECIKQFSVQEVLVKRWISSQEREGPS